MPNNIFPLKQIFYLYSLFENSLLPFVNGFVVEVFVTLHHGQPGPDCQTGLDCEINKPENMLRMATRTAILAVL